ncbi:MAG: DUF3048 domain-containing protein [Clostridia bacterium]|nr:DUF3048 domain-containing protein [Clostridia bacterium]
MKSASIKILVSILIIVIIIAAILLGMKFAKSNNILQTAVDKNEEQKNDKTVVEIKDVQIFKGTDRPIAVMIDNHKSAMPQANLTKAYMVYEIIVEGGETRLMALYKGKELEKLGPIRSSRHYFLDYALENDAIYVHFGFSPQAKNDISKLGVNNINGIYESSKNFWRVKDKYAPHNAVTSTKNVLEIAKRDNYRVTSDKESVLKYVGDEVNLNSDIIANTVTIPYSDSNTVSYEYDEETKTYTRYSRKIKQVDWDTKEPVTVKNIIVTFCKNTRLNDGENKDRQTIDNIKTLKGYYITNGKAIEITCEKTSRSGKTLYKTLDGKEIEVNDGNTFVQICPIDSKVTFTPGEQAEINE